MTGNYWSGEFKSAFNRFAMLKYVYDAKTVVLGRQIKEKLIISILQAARF
jgi:hypothetical protein